MSPGDAVKRLAHTGQSTFQADSLRDVDDRLAQIGLTPKTGWYVSILLYAAGGIPAALMPLIDPVHYSYGYVVLGGLAVAMSLLSILGLRYFANSHRATHLRLSFGMALIIVGAFIVGESLQAFLMLSLVFTVPPAIYYGIRAAIPYTIIAIAFTALAFLGATQPWGPAISFSSTVTVALAVGAMMFAQARTRSIARRNREMAYTDALTGLANTRALNQAIGNALEDTVNLRAALFAIDLDDFKQVNDRFDHQVGDLVLKAVAEELVKRGQPGDLFARRGGDEFSLFLRDPGSRDLGELSHRLAEAIAIARKRTCPDVSPSGSVAYVYARPDDTVGSILQRADDALHEAKVEYHRHDDPNRPVRLAIIDQRTESQRVEGEILSADNHPSRRSDDRDGRGRDFLRGSVRVDRPLWRMVSVLNAVVGAAVGVAAIAGWTGSLSAAEGAGLMGALLFVAAAGVAASYRPLPGIGVHVVYSSSIVILSVAIWKAGDAGAAYMDLYAVIALFAFHLFQSKVAVRYLPIVMGLFWAFAIGRTQPYAIAHVAVFSTMVLSISVMTAKVREVTKNFIAENWRLSQVDALTGLSNVRALRWRVDEVVANAESDGPRPTLLTIDLDEFKQVNDSFSHTVGDQVLVSVARAIADNVRAEDMVARRGGDEFMVVTVIEDEAEIQGVIQRVQEAIERCRRRICPQLVPTASIAEVHWNKGDDSDAFMHRADVALHESKLQSRRGRSADAS